VDIVSTSIFKTLAEWIKGEPLTAARLSEMVNALNQLAAKGNYGGLSSPPGGAVAAQFWVKDARYGDFVVCNHYDGATEPDDDTPVVLVAKPPQLRKTRYNNAEARSGETYTFADADLNADPPLPIVRTATNEDDDTEDQVIIPNYEVGDVIYAIKSVIRGTGVVTIPPNVSAGDGNCQYIEWLDLNVDGRAWAKKAD
jgi:hypothetical protein